MTDDCVLMSLYTQVIRCLVVGMWKACMPTTLVLGVLDTHPPKFCSVKPPIPSVIHCNSLLLNPKEEGQSEADVCMFPGTVCL